MIRFAALLLFLSPLAPPRAAADEKPFPQGAWTLALLPDTQYYSQSFPGVFDAQTAWLRHHAETRNIRFVLHLGDIVNGNSVPEWENARRSMSLLDGVLPYALVPGNHDYGPGGNATTRDSLFNRYFKVADYQGLPTFGGVMEPGKMDNTYHLFEAGGAKWIVIALEWGPRDSTVEWANAIMTRHPDRKGILVTHAYMNHNDQRYHHEETKHPQDHNPHHYQTPGGVNDGEQLWQKLVRKHDFVFTFNGHVLGDGTGFRTDPNDAGNPVHQMLANFQMRKMGGEGYLRLLEFQPDGKSVRVRSYSPLFHSYLPDTDQDFTIPLTDRGFHGGKYEVLDVSGWALHVDPALREGHREKTDLAIKLLRQQLDEIIKTLPAAAVTELKKVPLWFSSGYPDTPPRAEYHPSAAWLKENGRDPAMAKSVEFTNIGIFEQETRRMPNFALHELAHAYHDRVLGFGEPRILAAYAKAVESGSYDRVECRDGQGNRRTARAYAMTDAKEYLAEGTEAYFSTNDFFPFNREELARHDPDLHSLLEAIWSGKGAE